MTKVLLKCLTLYLILAVEFYKISLAILESREFSARQMGRSLAQCFGSDAVAQCLENEMITTIDTAIHSNDTWHLGDIIVLEKNSNIKAKDTAKLEMLTKKQRSLGDSLAMKLIQLAQSRSLKLQLPSGLTALLDRSNGVASGLDDFLDSAPIAETLAQEEGRKKKYKEKNIAMMGGMAMMAMVAQMFLGKVILIAGAAFVMAKIALLVSVLGSLKKGSSGSSGSTEHVIVTAAGGGGGGGGGGSGGHSHEHSSSGWHRSMPYEYHTMTAESPDNYNELASDHELGNEFRRIQIQTHF